MLILKIALFTNDRLEAHSSGISMFWVGRWTMQRSLCLLMRILTQWLFRKKRRWGWTRHQSIRHSRTTNQGKLFLQRRTVLERKRKCSIATRSRNPPAEWWILYMASWSVTQLDSLLFVILSCNQYSFSISPFILLANPLLFFVFIFFNLHNFEFW